MLASTTPEGQEAFAVGSPQATSSSSQKQILAIDAENAAHSIGCLAMAIVNLLHELLERQAIRRMENGTLAAADIERVGYCLMKQAEAIDTLCARMGIDKAELNLDLGPLGKLI